MKISAESSLITRLALPLLTLALFAIGCSKGDSGTSTADPSTPGGSAANVPTIELTFTYGSEKKAWIADVTSAFNSDPSHAHDGKQIHVNAIPMGSGECIDEILSGTRQTDLISPASGVFIKLGNAQSRAKSGDDLVGSTDNVVLSPVVIAMWRPMAEALGWGKKPIGWADVLAVTTNPQGWAGYGHPEWGKFKFGHTHPDFSNSGLIASLAMVYAANGKVAGLTMADVQSTSTGEFVGRIESSVQHYGSSTGFFSDRLTSGGPGYLSAAVLYESSVIEANQKPGSMPFPLVAIYPKEGTFWSDHPIGIVQRPWVTDERKAAAKIYTDFLLARPQQQKALTFGFRPADPGVAVTDPIAASLGVDPAEPKTTLQVPPADVMNAVLQVWHQHKRSANVVLVLDTSGSMKTDDKIGHAKAGAQQLLERLDDSDQLSLLPFSNEMRWSGQGLLISTARPAAIQTVQGLIADGGTRLYDSIDAAVQYLNAHPIADKISAVVVLTDGQDTDSALKLEPLISRIRWDGERTPIRVFTIGYGSGADEGILKRIADQTNAKYYKGTPENIREVFRDIATFF